MERAVHLAIMFDLLCAYVLYLTARSVAGQSIEPMLRDKKDTPSRSGNKVWTPVVLYS